jgi:hypothetical protein
MIARLTERARAVGVTRKGGAKPAPPPVLVATAVLVAAVLALVGCGGGGDEAGNVHADDASSWLYVQRADAGSLEQAGEGYALTLRGVDPEVLAFTDRPERQTALLTVPLMLETLFKGDQPPPNAAIELARGPEERDVGAFELHAPRYSRQGHTISYRAEVLEDVSGSGLSHLADRLDRRLPGRFGSASLYIDSSSLGKSCTVQVNLANGALDQVSSDKWSTDDWVSTPPSSIDSSGGGTASWESRGGAFRGCHNEVEFKSFSSGYFDIAITNPWTGQPQTSCDAISGISSCRITSSSNSGLALKITVLIELD